MIVVTGGAGFIGSSFIWKLNQEGFDNIIIVDNLYDSTKWENLVNLRYRNYFHRDEFIQRLLKEDFDFNINAIFHLGACSATTETDMDFLMENNFKYTQILAKWCLQNHSYFMYASSAATYGNGSEGFEDNEKNLVKLKPINRYGYSKHLFDLTAQQQDWAENLVGLKFFNVFGPNEYHKGDMRSVVCKAFDQVGHTKQMKLFKSYHPDFEDGGQKRDFIYVKDCVDVMWWLYKNPKISGLFNVGTGSARTWNDLANALFLAMDIPPSIEYIEMPDSLKNQYQYYTEATMAKLRSVGYKKPFTSLEHAVKDYVQKYMSTPSKHLSN
ncbi:ADP-glyceromanno-heptose 6-epimerase [Candidatus Marinamargulisbacteria bacterium SCGC AAA071-K20]|nr:ADP-glyceromanno-heptose 6-epimerase [Candidatus Marinamargulisbacteria bacterium SCGC AAA071-K20]